MVVAQVEELKRHLNARGLSTAGLKTELARRLKDAESRAAAGTAGQGTSPASGAIGAANPEDAETARKVGMMCDGWACV